MVRVVVADDHRLVRQAVASILQDAADIQVVEQAGTGEEALRAAREHAPDVILMDIQMPGMGGVEATRRILEGHPRIAVVMVTAHDAGPYPAHALRAGAMGYVHKGADRGELIEAIRATQLGRRYICADIVHRVALTGLDGAGRDPFDGLTQRELEVLRRVLDGQRSSRIAEELRLSPKTVSTYRVRLYQRLGVRNEAELTRVAVDYGLVGPLRGS